MEDKNLIVDNESNELVDIENIYNDIKNKILTARSKMLKLVMVRK